MRMVPILIKKLWRKKSTRLRVLSPGFCGATAGRRWLGSLIKAVIYDQPGKNQTLGRNLKTVKLVGTNYRLIIF